MLGTTPGESATPRSPIPMTGTWFGRYGMSPYELLGLIDEARGTTVSLARSLPALPTRVLAA